MKKKNKQKHSFIDKLSFGYFIIVILIYLIISPFVFSHEYKQNKDFQDILRCEYNNSYSFNETALFMALNQSNKRQEFCDSMEELTDYSDKIIWFVVIFWSLLIFEKDIYPNRKEIIKWLEEQSQD